MTSFVEIEKNFCEIQILTITKCIEELFKSYINLEPKKTSALTLLDLGNDNHHLVCNFLSFELQYVQTDEKALLILFQTFMNKIYNIFGHAYLVFSKCI